MIEIRNGSQKRMIALLAQESTLDLLRAMGNGEWRSAGELSAAVPLDPELIGARLSALSELGVVRGRDDEVRRYRLARPVIRIDLDLRSVPPGPGYILDVVRFYVRLLANLLDRSHEAGGRPLRSAALQSIRLVRCSLPEEERFLLSCNQDGVETGPCLRSLERRIMAGELTDADLPRVREAFLRALGAVGDGLKGFVDDSTVKLVFRLAARELLRDGSGLAVRFGLLEGIPHSYLKQVECPAMAETERPVASY
ncbi:MAG: hypothetical protein FJ149_10285 [Euryarchaeota archaeon]|nr:hypothetical protein [Euryarchaeota archaeon]